MKYPRSPKDPWEYEASSDICCLLIHGYTGYPFEMRPVSEALVASNIAHRVLRLPGHGERPEALNKYKWHDWYKAAEDAYLDLRRSYEKVIIIGLSMGGSLALHLAAHHHPDGVVTMGSPGNSFLKRLQYTCLIAGFRNKRRKRFRSVYYYKTASENLGYSKQTFISLCQLHRLLYHLQDDFNECEGAAIAFPFQK
jgi:carboxylesterase